MRIVSLAEIQKLLVYPELIEVMRDALVASARGESDTPMPMRLEIPSENAEVHIKSSYRPGGKYFALKIAGTFPGNISRGRSSSNGMMLLSSAETGEPLVFFADGGHLTDVRTAAAAAMSARELGRRDSAIGILGSGVQARLQARIHAEVLPIEQIFIWGRTPAHAAQCRRDLETLLPGVAVSTAASPAEIARQARLLITVTPSRQPLLWAPDLQPGTHISAVGSDSAGKQETVPATVNWLSGLEYDTGYNPRVAIGPCAGYYCSSLTVVEVHQAASGISNLWYHVGTLSIDFGGTPSVTWGPAYQFDYGYAPSVALCNGLAIEVHEGTAGTLWYSMGAVSGNQVEWGPSSQYDRGYYPSIASCGVGYPSGKNYLIEVHQALNPAKGKSTALWYHISTYNSASVTWIPAVKYDTGCRPRVALCSGLGPSCPMVVPANLVTEIHAGTCGVAGYLYYDLGSASSRDRSGCAVLRQ